MSISGANNHSKKNNDDDIILSKESLKIYLGKLYVLLLSILP